MNLNLFAISGLLIGFTSLSLGLVVYLKDRRAKLNKIWLPFAIAVAVWGFGGYKIATASEELSALFWWRITHMGVIFIPIFFWHFVYIFLNIRRSKTIFCIYLFGIFFLLVDFTKFFIRDVKFSFDSFYYITTPPFLYSAFVFLWFSAIIYVHYELFKALKKTHGIQKIQIKYFFLAMAIGFSGGSISYLPVFDINLYPLLNFTVPLYPIIMTYAILKHHLMNIRIIATELLTILIILLFAIKAILSQSRWELVFRISALGLIVFFGILLIKSVLNEVRRREVLNDLANKLKQANQKLKILDEAKSSFISIASHQLRTPMSAIKGYFSMLLEGDFGKLNQEQEKTVKLNFSVTEQLVRLVNAFLDISRIEAGRFALSLEKVQVEDLIREVVDEMHFQAKEKKLILGTALPPKKMPAIMIDRNRIKDVISNLVDNAIKYTKQGGITISARRAGEGIEVEVKDTGIGLEKSEIKSIFNKFMQGEGAAPLNLRGAGLGLFIIKKLINAHNGRVWAKSEGKNKGSVFGFYLPPRPKTTKMDRESIFAPSLVK